jgi:hypothetical protein
MKQTCGNCRLSYDDAEHSSICPHHHLLPPDDLHRKHAALMLLGRELRFADQPNGPCHRIETVSWEGMLTLSDLAGEFAPDAFVIAQRRTNK